LETDAFRYLEDDILLHCISAGSHTWVIEDWALSGANAKAYEELLTSDKIVWVLQNLSFDFQFLQYQLGVVPKHAVDTMCYGLGLSERGQDVGLGKLSQEYLNASGYKEEVRDLLKRVKKMSLIPREKLVPYGAEDAANTRELLPVLHRACEEEGTLGLVENLLIPAQRLFADMESHGVLVDQVYAKTLSAEWEPKMAKVEAELQQFAASKGFKASNCVTNPKEGELLNPRSPQQLAHLIYDLLRILPVPRMGRTTGKEFLEKYPDLEVSKLLAEYRTIEHMMRTYVYGILDDVWPADGRVHPSILLFGTVTGRLTIHEPPLQIIPKEGLLEEKGFPSIKRLFIAPPGYVIVEADEKQLELRVAWHYSGDKALGEALMSGDFHRRTAARVYHIAEDKVTKMQRHNSKYVSFGLMYGRTAYSLAKGEMSCHEREAQAFIDAFWGLYPRYREWWEGAVRTTLETGRLRTPFGRVRRWNLITDETEIHIRNQAVNFPIQSFASDLNLHAAIRNNQELRARKLGVPLFLVHDSCVFEIREDKLDEALPLIKGNMIDCPFDTCAEFDVEFKVGKSWGDAKEIAQ